MPILVAMACQMLALVSNRKALSEILGGFVSQVDPFTGYPRYLRSNISIDIRSKAQVNNIEKGSSRVKNFSWEKAGSQSIEVYKELLDK